MEQDNLLACAYCGAKSDSKDHVIPCSYLNTKSYDSNRVWIVNSCRDCNTLAGSETFFTLPDKAKYILEKFTHKYKKTLNTPEWSLKDLDDLSYSLHTMVFSSLVAKRVATHRKKHLEDIAEQGMYYMMPNFIKEKFKEEIDNIMEKENEYVPVYKYCQKWGIEPQNVYRWIREGKLKSGEDYDRESITSVRIRIKEDVRPPMKNFSQ
jgi:hypothetical protein